MTCPNNTHSIFFSALAQGLSSDLPDAASKSLTLTHSIWARALAAALAKLYTYTRARPPSRTLVDPLSAFITKFRMESDQTLRGGFAEAVAAAVCAAEDTRDIAARAGRSAYVEGDRLQKERIPDPGAWGVKIILENL
jgi:dihydroxyacetone kinase